MKKRQWKKVLAAGSAVAAAAIVKKTCESQARRQRQKETEAQLRKRRYGERQAYILGDGLTGLAAAFYLVKDARFPAGQIHVLGGVSGMQTPELMWQEDGVPLSAAFVPEAGCSGTGQYFLDARTNENFWELTQLSGEKSGVTARILGRNGRLLDLDGSGLGKEERMLLGKLLLMGEGELEGQTIAQWFPGDRFFRTGFWLLWSRLYGIREDCGLMEFRRLLLRKILYFGKLQDLSWAVPYSTDPREGFLRELRELLVRRGVKFEAGVRVEGLEFEENSLRISALALRRGQEEKRLIFEKEDFCILTDGDWGDWNTQGTLNQAPEEPALPDGPETGSFWAMAAEKRPGLLGAPEVFGKGGGLEAVAFSLVFRRDLCLDKLTELAGKTDPAGGEWIIGASPWGIRLFLPPQPYRRSQREEEAVILGAGLYPERAGSYVKKPMTACTGWEIWLEVASLLGIPNPPLGEGPLAVPVLRAPYFFSPFQPHSVGDRAPVLPMTGGNLALAGWFAEVPEEVPGSREQQVRSARMAVYGLLQVEKEIPPVTPFRKDAKILAKAVQAVYR